MVFWLCRRNAVLGNTRAALIEPATQNVCCWTLNSYSKPRACKDEGSIRKPAQNTLRASAEYLMAESLLCGRGEIKNSTCFLAGSP
jgi:hypothetical protein